jgi:hypothetical protein
VVLCDGLSVVSSLVVDDELLVTDVANDSFLVAVRVEDEVNDSVGDEDDEDGLEVTVVCVGADLDVDDVTSGDDEDEDGLAVVSFEPSSEEVEEEEDEEFCVVCVSFVSDDSVISLVSLSDFELEDEDVLPDDPDADADPEEEEEEEEVAFVVFEQLPLDFFTLPAAVVEVVVVVLLDLLSVIKSVVLLIIPVVAVVPPLLRTPDEELAVFDVVVVIVGDDDECTVSKVAMDARCCLKIVAESLVSPSPSDVVVDIVSVVPLPVAVAVVVVSVSSLSSSLFSELIEVLDGKPLDDPVPERVELLVV